MKRFVSYLYSIYNNQKIHNAGFARMELRTGRNRVDIHLKENGYAGKTGTVYLFIRKQENIQGISIGNITFRGSQADFRYEQAEENIGQTPWQIMHMNGILIMIDDRAAFLSQWDEQPVDTTRFEVWNIDKLKEVGAGDEQQKYQTDQKKVGQIQPRHMENNAGIQHLDQSTLDSGNKTEIDLTYKVDAGQKVGNISSTTTRSEAEQESAADQCEIKKRSASGQSGFVKGAISANTAITQAEAGKRLVSATLSEDEKMPASVLQSEGENISVSVIQSEDEKVQTSAIQSKVRTKQQDAKDAGDRYEASYGEQGESEGASKQQMNIQTAELQPQVRNVWNQTWRYMLRMYPVLNQFTGKNNVLCVRIEIKDIRMLPEKYWSMVNNSFLLHGFFNYRYLAFGRIDQNWFIGIPGIYQNQEHVMASIFGFPDFLPQIQKNERGEQPGYWYRILEI